MGRKMRVSIREQLGILVLVCSLLALMVLALATVCSFPHRERPPNADPSSVVPELQLHHRNPTLGSCPYCVSQGCPGLLDLTSLPIPVPGRNHSSPSTIRLVALHSGYLDSLQPLCYLRKFSC